MEFVPQAVLVLSNSHGLEIMVDDRGDGLYYRFTDETEVKEAEIKYNDDEEFGELGEPYFETDNFIEEEQRYARYDISEFMRIPIFPVPPRTRRELPRDEHRRIGNRD